MNTKVVVGSFMAGALLGFGMLAGTVIGASNASAQSATGTTAPAAAATAGTTAEPSKPAPRATPDTSKVKITQQQAEQAAIAAAPGSTVDHTSLQDQNGTPVYDVDFTNGGGAMVNAETGAVIKTEAAGTDQGGGPHGDRGGQDQAALAAKATVTKAQAEQTALSAAPGSTVDHSSLAQAPDGTIFWDVDFTNQGGVKVNAQTGAVIAVEAPGTDTHQGGPGGRHGGRGGKGGQTGQTAPSGTPTPSQP